MASISLSKYLGKYLPHSISDNLFGNNRRAIKTIKDKLNATVVKVEETPRNTRFITKSGYIISSNGYVTKK
jgi:hypothetical protein